MNPNLANIMQKMQMKLTQPKKKVIKTVRNYTPKPGEAASYSTQDYDFKTPKKGGRSSQMGGYKGWYGKG